MKPLATEILGEIKKKAIFWKVATIITFAIAVMELVVIVF